MHADGPRSWFLDSSTSWGRSGVTDGVAVGEVLRLAADPDGRLALAYPDGTLGGLVLPRWMAIDDGGSIHLLQEESASILRLDRRRRRFAPLPSIGGRGDEPRQLAEPSAIGIAGGDLYVVERDGRRVQTFSLSTSALLHVWDRAPDESRDVEEVDWRPVDVATLASAAYVLDRRGRVYLHRVGTDLLVEVARDAEAEGSGVESRWSRIAVDRSARLYVYDATARHLQVFDPEGRPLRVVTDAGDVRHEFEAPPVRLDAQQRFCVPELLLQPCATQERPAPVAETPIAACEPSAAGGIVFDRRGEVVRVALDESPGAPLYRRSGTWKSTALESGIYDCQWHRVELDADLPPGTKLKVETKATSAEVDDWAVQWVSCYSAVGEMQPRREEAPPTAAPHPGARRHEFLVQSRPGQYLRLKLSLEGDGYLSPAVHSMRLLYPRESYLQYLPAVFASDENRWFLERFLAIFQTEWEELERQVEEIPRYFDPRAVPEGPFLHHLARLLALPVEGTWTDEQNRQLLKAAPRHFRKRGTPAGLRHHLRAYLQNLCGLTPEEQGDYPQLVEGFRERDHFILSRDATASGGSGVPLWSDGVVGRAQLGISAREGEARLVSTGDPQRDLFHHHAYRARVFVPSAWVRTAADERTLRRAIEAEKPAHVDYELKLVRAELRVGIQSTIGIDTILGAHAAVRLACRPAEGSSPEAIDPSSAELRGRLGWNTVLFSAGEEELRLGSAQRLRGGEEIR